MNIHPIAKDHRYIVTREWCGCEKPQFIIRFCGEWIDRRSNYQAAVVLAVGCKAIRDGALVFEGIDQ
jgi:hypothetical protein